MWKVAQRKKTSPGRTPSRDITLRPSTEPSTGNQTTGPGPPQSLPPSINSLSPPESSEAPETQICNRRPPQAFYDTKIGCWNVRSVRSEIHQVALCKDLEQHQINSCAIIDHQLPTTAEETQADGSDSNFFGDYWIVKNNAWKDVLDRDKGGVAFVLDKKSKQQWIAGGRYRKSFTNRILKIILKERSTKLHLICAYGPWSTQQRNTTKVEEFYCGLEGAILSVPPKEKLILLGDFNARLGNDMLPTTDVIGQWLTEYKSNSNGRKLVEFCTNHNLCIPQTFASQPRQQKVTFLLPEESNLPPTEQLRKARQLDYVITRQTTRRLIRSVVAVGGIQTSPSSPGLLDPLSKTSDYALVVATIRAAKKPRNHPKRPTRPTNAVRDAGENTIQTYQQALMGLLPSTLEGSVEEAYETLRNAVLEANS